MTKRWRLSQTGGGGFFYTTASGRVVRFCKVSCSNRWYDPFPSVKLLVAVHMKPAGPYDGDEPEPQLTVTHVVDGPYDPTNETEAHKYLDLVSKLPGLCTTCAAIHRLCYECHSRAFS